MKTLRILLFLFFISPLLVGQTQNAVNGWLLTGNIGSDPKIMKTSMESGIQVFSTWGTTVKNGGWYIQSTFDKDFWDRYYPLPDSFYIELRIKNQKGLSELRVAIPAQDSSNANNGYEKKLI